MDREKLKLEIIKVLKLHPNGLKAREIASMITNADKSSVNSVLYANTDVFSANNYVWKLVSLPKPPAAKSPTINKQNNFSHIKSSTITSSSTRPKSTYTKPSSNLRLLEEARENEEKINLFLKHPNLSLNMSLSEMKNEIYKANHGGPPKKCMGNCSLCNRDKCIEEI